MDELLAGALVVWYATTMTETWKPVGPFAPNYSASSLGRIRRDSTGHILKNSPARGGYYAVSVLSQNHGGKWGLVLTHKLIGIAFHGMPKPGQINRHLNGVRTDNRPENLCWGTYQENAQDSIDHGTVAHGARTNHVALTDEQVVSIREERAAGAGIQALGKKYGVAWSHISAICTGKWWTRVGGPRTEGLRSHRTTYPRGEQRSDAKMSDESVRSLRADREAGMTYSKLSEKYGICGSRACRIVHGRAWGHV